MTFQVTNILEKAVRDGLDEVLATLPHVCRCERCQADILCWTLNQIPPRYVAHRYGEILSAAEFEQDQKKAEIITTLMKAIRLVQDRPHDDKPSRPRTP